MISRTDSNRFELTIGGGSATMHSLPTSQLLMTRKLGTHGTRAELALERLNRSTVLGSMAPLSDRTFAATMAAAASQLNMLIDQFIR